MGDAVKEARRYALSRGGDMARHSITHLGPFQHRLSRRRRAVPPPFTLGRSCWTAGDEASPPRRRQYRHNLLRSFHSGITQLLSIFPFSHSLSLSLSARPPFLPWTHISTRDCTSHVAYRDEPILGRSFQGPTCLFALSVSSPPPPRSSQTHRA